MANTLVNYITAKITAVKSLIVQTPVVNLVILFFSSSLILPETRYGIVQGILKGEVSLYS